MCFSAWLGRLELRKMEAIIWKCQALYQAKPHKVASKFFEIFAFGTIEPTAIYEELPNREGIKTKQNKTAITTNSCGEKTKGPESSHTKTRLFQFVKSGLIDNRSHWAIIGQ